ncbi:MAG: DMT family transporter [Bacteroidota bacterium]
MKNNWLSYLLVCLAVSFWAGNFFWTVPVLQHVAPLEAANLRYGIAGGLLLLLVLFSQRIPWDRIKANWKGILGVALSGIILFNYTYFRGMQDTSPMNASLIVGLNPVTTLILSIWMLQVRPTVRQIIGSIISLVGVSVVIVQGKWENLIHFNLNPGDFWILGANVCFAMNHVLVKKYLSSLSPLIITLTTSLIGWVFFVLVSGSSLVAKEPSTFPESFWIPMLCIGALGTTFAYIFWNRGIVQIGPDKSALFLNLIPVLAACYSIVLGKPLTMAQIIGGLLVIIGILVAQNPRIYRREK